MRSEFRTFKRGVYPKEFKITSRKKIEILPLPSRLVLSLKQHIGCNSVPIVKVGDLVKKYQKIADIGGKVCSTLHSPTSGKVVAIESAPYPVDVCDAIIIEPDNKEESIIFKKNDYKSLTREEIIEIIKEAGIVGMGGATFPTHIKIDNPDKNPEFLIINGCECEPYLTSDHRLMLEYPEELIIGCRILLKATKAKRCIIGIEDNKKDAYKLLKNILKNESHIIVRLVKTKYPQGAEKLLIYALTKREVPIGKLPIDVSCIVQNVGTAKAVYDAVSLGKPLVERIVTISGDVNNPRNVLCPIGATYKDLVDFSKGTKGEVNKIITGGPMMGISQKNLDVPIIKGTNGVIVWTNPLTNNDYSHCIRCGKCIDVCPYNLMPTQLAKYSAMGKYAISEDYHLFACMECGCCSYVCPSKIPLVQFIRLAKSELNRRRKK
jgi:Na+-translocating ferredoxin:NAD+ oxidoreductase subunit C